MTSTTKENAVDPVYFTEWDLQHPETQDVELYALAYKGFLDSVAQHFLSGNIDDNGQPVHFEDSYSPLDIAAMKLLHPGIEEFIPKRGEYAA